MSVTTSAGTVLYISASNPATFDQAGYEASLISSSLVPVAEVVQIPQHGRSYNPVEHLPLASRTVQLFKGSRREGTLDIPLGRDSDDAGQIILKAALDSDNNYTFKIAYPSGDAEYFQAKVMGLMNAAEGADSIVSRTLQLAITANAAGVGIIEVLAP